jgi:mannose-6-phosphate isomerase-like protein (cupin superfamily)
MSYLTNIVYDTSENQSFRTVLHTAAMSQLVVMSIPPGGEIGMETHDSVEQTLFFLSGSGVAVLNGERQEIHPGDVLVVTPGIMHNVLNTASVPLKIYTIYTPPNHLEGRVHATKADADRDTEDEAFGEAAGGTVSLNGIALNGEERITPGFLPDIEPRPAPGNPLENPDAPAISVHDERRRLVGV